MTSKGQLTTLVNFDRTNGASPLANLIQARDGNFYGTTLFEDGAGPKYAGVFRMTPSGQLTALADSRVTSETALIQGKYSDSFYGTTIDLDRRGPDTIFRMTPNGKVTTLAYFVYRFGDDSEDPNALIQARDGYFYGTTTVGSNDSGTVFRMTYKGQLKTLVKFNGTNGAGPSAALIQGRYSDYLYGTTGWGGTSGGGTVFRMTPGGQLTTLVSFNGTNGSGPAAALLQAKDGFFYGTTVGGGTNGYGTVFRFKLN